VLFQFPPYFTYRDSNPRLPLESSRSDAGASIGVEFRHPSWVADGKQREATLGFIRDHGLYFVSIDAPEDKSIVPSFMDATGDIAYVRFHGRNRDAWFRKMRLRRSASSISTPSVNWPIKPRN